MSQINTKTVSGTNFYMIIKTSVFCFLAIANIVFIFAEETEPISESDELKYIISLDTGLTLTALKNWGYGIGIYYERKLTDFLSIKPGFGHMVCFSEIMAVTVNLQLFLYYYPLSNGLDKLYIGIGNGTDFVMYPGEENMKSDTAVSVIALLGWKWKILEWLMIEPYMGWKFIIVVSDNNENINNYLNDGLQWGINTKLFIKNRKKR